MSNLENVKEDLTISKLNNTKVESMKNNFTEYPSVLERYYTPMYCMHMDGQTIEHHCILFHSNKICLLTVALNHPIIKDQKTIKKVNYILEGNIDRTKNKVVGKGKRGGQKLQPNTLLCTIDCCDGSTYKIYSCIKGKLIEMNENLYECPNLLLSKPNTEGHIAVILSDLSTVDMCKREMIDEKEYKKIINDSNC